MSSSDATLTLMSWLRMLPSCRVLEGTEGASWPRLNAGHLTGLDASSASGSSFTQKPLFSASFWFAAATERQKIKTFGHLESSFLQHQNPDEAQNMIFTIWCFIAKAVPITVPRLKCKKGCYIFIHLPFFVCNASGVELVQWAGFASGPHIKSSEEDAGRKVKQGARRGYFRKDMTEESEWHPETRTRALVDRGIIIISLSAFSTSHGEILCRT